MTSKKRLNKKTQMIKSWLDISASTSVNDRLAELLFDSVTDLPTIPVLFKEIQNTLVDYGQLGILYINIIKYSSIEEIYGWKAFDDLLIIVSECLTDIKQNYLREKDIVSELMVSGNAFVLLLSPPRTKDWYEFEDLDKVRLRIANQLKKYLKERVEDSLFQKFGCFIGCSIIDYDISVRLERLIYRALEEALQDSTLQETRDYENRKRRLRDIIRSKKISTVFQPIIDFDNKKVIGYEALSRGPKGEFEHPDKLFKVAYEADLVWRLERVCREKALMEACKLNKDQLFFLNIDPDAMNDPQFRSKETTKFLENIGLAPERIVFEITERTAIKDYTLFRQSLELFKAYGFQVAVDDVGSGYAGLQSIAEVKPDFIKIDMSLIRNIHKKIVKQNLVETIIKFSRKMDVKVIVEGIENMEEYSKILQLGARYGQGYLFAYPESPFPKLRTEILSLSEIKSHNYA